jgi:hypothetical protein
MGGSVVVLPAVWALRVRWGQWGLRRLAKRLGTRLPLRAADDQGGDLQIDVGDAWGRLSAAEKAAERIALALGGARLGYQRVYVHAHGVAADPPGAPAPAAGQAAVTVVSQGHGHRDDHPAHR